MTRESASTDETAGSSGRDSGDVVPPETDRQDEADIGGGRSTDASERAETRTEPTDEEILAHARVHARSVADEIDVDLDALEWAVSARAKRRAGVCKWDADDAVATIVLSRRAYETYDRASFEAVVRHELIHAWEFQTFGESDHGARFREVADRLNVSIHCDSFTDPRYRLRCRAGDCDWSLDRHRASKPIKDPKRYRCGDCGGDLFVEHVASGRTWTSAAGYESTRSTLGADW